MSNTIHDKLDLVWDSSFELEDKVIESLFVETRWCKICRLETIRNVRKVFEDCQKSPKIKYVPTDRLMQLGPWFMQRPYAKPRYELFYSRARASAKREGAAKRANLHVVSKEKPTDLQFFWFPQGHLLAFFFKFLEINTVVCDLG